MITFKGVKSDSLGIVFSNFPNLPTGSRRTEYLTIPGRDGTLTKKDDSLENVNIVLTGHAIDCTRDELLSYFSGSGNLIFDDYPDRYYKVSIDSAVEIAYPLGNNSLIQFLVTLRSEPYAKLISNDLVVVDKVFSVNNIYNLKAYPYIKITGNGNVIVKRNGVQILQINNVIGYVELDSELNSIFKGNSSMERNSLGTLPFIAIGNNSFAIEGSGVTKVEIRYNWRVM